MSMTTETANAYWQGKVNLTFAMAKGTVKVEGSVTRLCSWRRCRSACSRSTSSGCAPTAATTWWCR